MFPIDGSWRAAFAHSLFIDASWRQRRFVKKEASALSLPVAAPLLAVWTGPEAPPSARPWPQHRKHTSYINRIHVRGDRALTAGDDESMCIFGLPPRNAQVPAGASVLAWETALSHTMGFPAAVTCARFLSDTRVLCAHSGSEFEVYDISDVPASLADVPAGRPPGGRLPSGTQVSSHRIFFHKGAAQMFEVSPHGGRSVVAAACEPGSGVHVYDAETMSLGSSLEGHDSEVFALAWADCHTVYAAFGDSKARARAARGRPCAAAPARRGPGRG